MNNGMRPQRGASRFLLCVSLMLCGIIIPHHAFGKGQFGFAVISGG